MDTREDATLMDQYHQELLRSAGMGEIEGPVTAGVSRGDYLYAASRDSSPYVDQREHEEAHAGRLVRAWARRYGVNVGTTAPPPQAVSERAVVMHRALQLDALGWTMDVFLLTDGTPVAQIGCQVRLLSDWELNAEAYATAFSSAQKAGPLRAALIAARSILEQDIHERMVETRRILEAASEPAEDAPVDPDDAQDEQQRIVDSVLDEARTYRPGGAL
jgi:hypothetical protein